MPRLLPLLLLAGCAHLGAVADPMPWQPYERYEPAALADLVAREPLALGLDAAGCWHELAPDEEPVDAVVGLAPDDLDAILDEAERRGEALDLAYQGRDSDRALCDGLLGAAALEVESSHLAARRARLAGLPWFGAGVGVGAGGVAAILLAVVLGGG